MVRWRFFYICLYNRMYKKSKRTSSSYARAYPVSLIVIHGRFYRISDCLSNSNLCLSVLLAIQFAHHLYLALFVLYHLLLSFRQRAFRFFVACQPAFQSSTFTHTLCILYERPCSSVGLCHALMKILRKC